MAAWRVALPLTFPDLTLTSERVTTLARSHGEGEHNTATDVYGEWGYYCERWRDAQLTDAGRGQATDVGRSLAAEGHPHAIELICASPLTRTLQTAQCIATQLRGPPPIVALEAVRERLDGSQPANARRPLSVLKQAHPAIDFSALTDEEDNVFAAVQTVVEETAGTSFTEGEDEPAMRTLANYGFSRSHCERALADATASGVKDGELERTAAAVKWLKEEAKLEPLFTEWSPYEDDVGTAVRVAHFLAWLRGRPEGHILVSTHCMFLYTLFGRHDAMADVMLCDDEVSPLYFARGERRTVQILFDDRAKL